MDAEDEPTATAPGDDRRACSMVAARSAISALSAALAEARSALTVVRRPSTVVLTTLNWALVSSTNTFTTSFWY
jgi:hypothetical protein